MNSVNSRNMYFMILFGCLLVGLFLYITFSNDFTPLYVDLP